MNSIVDAAVKTAIIFDTETTGLTLHPYAKQDLQPRIIEFAALKVDVFGNELAELEFLCYPGQQITPEITGITGITNADLAGKPAFAAHLDEIIAFFEDTDGLICHNLPFDHALLAGELERCGCKDFPWPRHNICTVQEFDPLWGRRMKLIELYKATTGKEYKQTHRGMDDVRALAEIVKHHKLVSLIPDGTRPPELCRPTGYGEPRKIGFDKSVVDGTTQVRTSRA
jgi:DNA polymerase III epsilon subunit-like protein